MGRRFNSGQGYHSRGLSPTCSTMSNKKSELLGMKHGTANGRLRKMLLYSLAGRLGLLNCHQCGGLIDSIDEFTIEHKDPWEAADNPRTAFFDLENISFSHFKCNIAQCRRPNKVYATRADAERAKYLRQAADPERWEHRMATKRAREKRYTQARREKRIAARQVLLSVNDSPRSLP